MKYIDVRQEAQDPEMEQFEAQNTSGAQRCPVWGRSKALKTRKTWDWAVTRGKALVVAKSANLLAARTGLEPVNKLQTLCLFQPPVLPEEHIGTHRLRPTLGPRPHRDGVHRSLRRDGRIDLDRAKDIEIPVQEVSIDFTEG
jgi:hypothetical protein